MDTTSTPRAMSVLDLHAYLGEFDPFALKPLSDAWRAAGVGWMAGVGSDVPTSEAAVEAAWSLPNTVAGVGLHPKHLPAGGGESADQLADLAAVAELATDPQVAVISDAGVDEAADASLELQHEVFRALLDIAVANRRSVLVHWNAPISALLDAWDAHPSPPTAALLEFNGDSDQAAELIGRGFYFSISPDAVGISGAATTASDVLVALPAERLFVHSSAHAQQSAEVTPAIVAEVVTRLAAHREAQVESLVSQINANMWEFLAWRAK